MKIYYSSKFFRAYTRLPRSVKQSAEKTEEIFRKNPSDKRLETHKLHGKYKKYHAFSITDKYRVMFQKLKSGDVAFINVGTHDIYK